MGIFDKLFKVNESRARELKLTKEEAFLGIAFSSVAVDDIISQEEMLVVAHTLGRMKTFRTYHPDQMVQMINKFLKIIKREGPGTIINASKSVLNQEMRETAFAMAVDIILADGVVDSKEKEFLETLKEAIELSDEFVTKVVEVLIIKNRGALNDFSTEGDSLFYG